MTTIIYTPAISREAATVIAACVYHDILPRLYNSLDEVRAFISTLPLPQQRTHFAFAIAIEDPVPYTPPEFNR